MLIYVISLRIISGFGEMGVDDPQRNKLILNTFFVAHSSCIVYYMFKGKKILGHIPAEQTQILWATSKHGRPTNHILSAKRITYHKN